MPVTGLAGAGGGPFAGTFGSSIESFVYTPTILSPTGDLVLNPVTLTASDFASEGLVKVHVSSDWQIATDSNFSNVVKSTTNDTTNKTSWSPSGDLDLGTTYYARVRYAGGPKEAISEWSATHTFKMMAVPVVSWTTDTPSSWNPTAGNSRTFNATATDTANPGGGHNTYTYQWYRNGSPVSGYTGQTFNFYSPCYYSDNGNNIYCRVTISNAVGSTSSNSTTCSISVTRNVKCDQSIRFDNINFSGGGNKTGGGTGNWGEWTVPSSHNGIQLNEICKLSWNLEQSLAARARPGRCSSGYKMTLRFYITGANVNYDNVQTQEAADGNHCYFYPENAGNIPANGSRPKFQIEFRHGTDYSRCNPPESHSDIYPEQDGDAMGWVDVTYKTYPFDSRP